MTIRVVVSLDGTPLSESILPVVRGLAERVTMRVTLVSVIDTPLDYGWADEPRVRDLDAANSAVAARERYLYSRVKQLGDIPIDVAVRLGRPADQILEVADDQEADLIAIASRAHSGIRRFFVGSVASRVLQGSTRPVLIVRYRGEETEPEPVRINRVLVPLDGSEFAEAALGTVRALFGDSDVALHLVQIIGPLRFVDFHEVEGYSPDDLTAFADRFAQNARKYLLQLADELEREVPKVTWEVDEGSDVEEGIERAASASGADLIAMSTHGRTGIRRFVFGSIAERVLQEADYPILMVRPPLE